MMMLVVLESLEVTSKILLQDLLSTSASASIIEFWPWGPQALCSDLFMNGGRVVIKSCQRLAPVADANVNATVRSIAHRSVVAGFQKRKRNPAVGAMLLCWRKPEANPPFTCVNMIPE